MDLVPGLTALGLRSGLLQDVSSLRHEAIIEVDEEGTEGAAAAAAVVAGTSVKQRFRATRPFLFALRDNPSGLLLFLGKITSPSSLGRPS